MDHCEQAEEASSVPQQNQTGLLLTDTLYDRTFMLFLFPSPTQLLYMLRVTASEGGTGEECKDLARDRPRTPFVHFLESWIYMQ